MHHPCLGADAEYESAQFPDRRPVFSPRFAAIYHRLRTLPRRVRKALQRRYKAPLVGVALLLATQPLTGEAANFTAGTAEEFVSAVNAANSTDEADTITLTADITLSEPIRGPTPYGRSGILVSSTLTIAGKGHTLRREPRNTEQFRLLAVTASGNLTLQDTTLSGGYSAGQTGGYSTGWGGAIFTKGQLTLEGCTISGNTAVGRGGGILGGRQITNSTISGNTAGRDGGGVFDSFGTLVLANSTISGNTAGEDGGGVGNVGDITNSTVRDNIAGGYGGGIAGVGKLTDSLVSGNIARAKGGGVFAVGALVNSTISGNTATGSGGGVFLITGPDRTVELTNSTISGNTANGNGGGVYSSLFGATATLINNTISGNTADGNGGGVFLNPGPQSLITLTSSTVGDNTAGGNGGGVYTDVHEGTPDFGPGAGKLSRNLTSGNSAASGAEMFHTKTRGSFSATLNLFGHNGLTTAQAVSGVPAEGDNLVVTSDGAKPTALAAILDTKLQDNGGPTPTQNLVTGSPAIDAAPADANCPATDQRGAPRPFGPACDIGAVEFGAAPSTLDCSTATARVQFPQLENRHRYPVAISGVTAPLGDSISLTINSIFQDEPVTSPSGTTCPDGIGVGTAVAKVRNERIVAGDGRVYHIRFTATDTSGESCTGEAKACVPAKPETVCVDEGTLFDSTRCP